MNMCEGPTDYQPANFVQTGFNPWHTDLPVIGQMTISTSMTVSAPDRPVCLVGMHDYQLVDEPGRVGYIGTRDRLILYCRRCGDIIERPCEDPYADK